MGISYNIKGLQEAQQRNLTRLVNLTGKGAMGDAIIDAAAETHRLLTANTPWDTGALRASRRVVTNLAELRAQIFTSRNSYNPRSSTSPAEYDIYLHEKGFKPGLRGGILASMPYTVQRNGAEIQRAALNRIARVLVK